jgi:hypothetical protein
MAWIYLDQNSYFFCRFVPIFYPELSGSLFDALSIPATSSISMFGHHESYTSSDKWSVKKTLGN